VHRSLLLGIDDPTGSPSGRTRCRDACTSTPERSHSASPLCVPGSGREPRRRRTSGAHLGAASSRPQGRRERSVVSPEPAKTGPVPNGVARTGTDPCGVHAPVSSSRARRVPVGGARRRPRRAGNRDQPAPQSCSPEGEQRMSTK